MGVHTPMGRGNFEGEGRPIVKYRDTLRSSAAEPIEMLFGFWPPIGPKNRVLDGGPNPSRRWVILGERGAHCKV